MIIARDRRWQSRLLQKPVLLPARQFSRGWTETSGQLIVLRPTLLYRKKWADAETLLRECLAIGENAQPDAFKKCNRQSMLAAEIPDKSKFAKAEPLLLKGYEGMKELQATIPPQGKTRISESLSRLVDLYTTLHAAEPDKGDEIKAADMQMKLEEHNSAGDTTK